MKCPSSQVKKKTNKIPGRWSCASAESRTASLTQKAEWMYSSTHSFPRQYLKVNGHASNFDSLIAVERSAEARSRRG